MQGLNSWKCTSEGKAFWLNLCAINIFPSLTYSCSKSAIETIEQGVKFIINKGTRQRSGHEDITQSMTLFWWLLFTLNIFHISPIVSIIDHSFLQCWNPPFLREPPLPFWVHSSLKSVPPLSESNPNWCMQVVRNTLKWRYYVSYYTQWIENIINIALLTFTL